MPRLSFLLLSQLVIVALLLCIVRSATGAQLYREGSIEIHDISPVAARSHEPIDVLSAALQTVFRDQQVCCGKDSGLIDSVARTEPLSLKSVAERLNGRHLYSDGRPFQVTADFVAPDAVSAGRVISMIAGQHPPLMVWNAHLYVIYGVDYRWMEDASTGATSPIIRKFLLWDLRYSDSRRDVIFDREREDPAKVQGLLFLETTSDSRP